MLINRPHIFKRERLEVEPVAGVIVGRDSFRIAVDHDRLVTVLMQRERSVAAAIIELNSLPDAVGPTAQNNDFLFLGRCCLVLVFVSRIKIRCEALKFGGASIHPLVHRQHAVLLAQVSDFFLSFQPPYSRQTAVRESHALGLAQHFGGNRFHRVLLQLKLHVVNLFELIKKPWIYRGHLRDLLDRVSLAQRVLYICQPFGMRRLRSADALSRIKGAYAFHQRLFKRAADGHDFPHRLHLRAQVFICSRKFLKLPLRNLHHNVVERRFETGGCFAGNVVRNLIQRVPHGQFGCDLRNRKSRSLRRQRR